MLVAAGVDVAQVEAMQIELDAVDAQSGVIAAHLRTIAGQDATSVEPADVRK